MIPADRQFRTHLEIQDAEGKPTEACHITRSQGIQSKGRVSDTQPSCRVGVPQRSTLERARNRPKTISLPDRSENKPGTKRTKKAAGTVPKLSGNASAFRRRPREDEARFKTLGSTGAVLPVQGAGVSAARARLPGLHS